MEEPMNGGGATDRRTFLKGALLAGGATGFPNITNAQTAVPEPGKLPLTGNLGVPKPREVVTGNWGVHATLKKRIFAGADRS